MADDSMDAWYELFGQDGQVTDVGQDVLVSTGPTGRSTSAIDVEDFTMGYRGVEQFQGKEAADAWALENANTYNIDPDSINIFLETETYDPTAVINNEVDFTVGGYDTDLEKQGFQASDAGQMIVTGDEDTQATISYPDDEIYGPSAGLTVDAASIYGTPDLVVGEPVSGEGGVTILNPKGLAFGGDSPLLSSYNTLARASKTIPFAGQAGANLGDGMDGETWIAIYEDVLPEDLVSMVASSFGIAWSPKTKTKKTTKTDGSSTTTGGSTDGGTTTIDIGGSGDGDYTSTIYGTTPTGPGSTVPNLGYFTDEGFGPFFTPDTSYSSYDTFVSPYTGNPLATLFDVGLSSDQFFGGPGTMTTNQPLSAYGYTEDTFAPPEGGIFNLDSFRGLNLTQGLSFGDYKPAGTSVITGGGNVGTGPGGGISSVFTGGQGTTGTGTTGLINNTGLTGDYVAPGEDIITESGGSSTSSGGFDITGSPFLDAVLVGVAGDSLYNFLFGEGETQGYAGKIGQGIKDFFTGTDTKIISPGDASVYEWGPDTFGESTATMKGLGPARISFEFGYNNIDAYNKMVADGKFTGTFDEYNKAMLDSYEKFVTEEWGSETWAGESSVIEQKTFEGDYDEPFKMSEEEIDESLSDTEEETNFENATEDSVNSFLESINFNGNASSFLTGLQNAGFSYQPGELTWTTGVDGSTLSQAVGGYKTITLSAADVASGGKYANSGKVAGDVVTVGEGGEILTGMDALNAEVLTFFSDITPDFIEDALDVVGNSIPPGVKKGLTILAQIGGGIEGVTEALKFIDDPEPETALRAASGVLAATGQFGMALAVKAVAELVDAIFGGYDQPSHRSVYANLDFDDFDPLGYSQGDYDSGKAAGEGMNELMVNIMSDVMLDDLKALEDEYGIDIKGDLQIHYSALDGFFYTIGNEDVTGFLERLDARDGGKDIEPYEMYRRNLGTLDFDNNERLLEQLGEFKETIISDMRRVLDAGYTDFSDFQMKLSEAGLEEAYNSLVDSGMTENEIQMYLLGTINVAGGQGGNSPLLSWALRNGKFGDGGLANLATRYAA